jgi:prophage regulatory protein
MLGHFCALMNVFSNRFSEIELFHIEKRGPNMDRFLRRKEVEEITSLKDPQMWREEKVGRFPKRRKLTQRTVGWRQSEIDEWMNSRAASTGEFPALDRGGVA